ncbi:MAG TPA: YlbF family regulator [Syntrophomonadaceae bacterium]|nr:YlbF family regulator [Syntrophomonadaceae bacterium]
MGKQLSPYDTAHELARSILNSEVYGKYVTAKREVESNPEFKEQIVKLRTLQMELDRAQLTGQDLPPDKLIMVRAELARMATINEISSFLDAEGKFIQLFNDIQGIIQKAIEDGFR